MDQTLQFYEENTQDFVSRTLTADMGEAQQRFLFYIAPGAQILDLGCGAGRDSISFQEHGYHVEAVDGSPALCAVASKLLGKPVRQLLFEDLDYKNAFDAVWASASLLHVPSASMTSILKKIWAALKPQGVFYSSVKRGDFEGERNGRYFTDYTEDRLCGLLTDCGFLILDQWTNEDVRPERSEFFVNVIARKS